MPDTYIVMGWAGKTLIVSRASGDDGLSSLLTMNAPDEADVVAQQGYLMAISPDGSQIAYNSFTAEGEQLELRSLLTGETRQVETAVIGITNGAWVQTTLVVGTLGPNGSGLAAVDTAGSRLQLAALGVDPGRSPSWSVPFISEDGTIGALGTNGVIVADPVTGQLPAEPHLLVVCPPKGECWYEPIAGVYQIERVRNPSGGDEFLDGVLR